MMKKAILALRKIGDPCLREESVALTTVGPGERMLINAMIETMYSEEGVGLAAPQVGINKQIIVIDVGNGPMALINPDIIERAGKSVMEEGCLSVPKGCVKIERPETIKVRFLDDQGIRQEITCGGLMSRAIQHEWDHLHGKLIVDYADDKEKQDLKKLFPDVML